MAKHDESKGSVSEQFRRMTGLGDRKSDKATPADADPVVLEGNKETDAPAEKAPAKKAAGGSHKKGK